MGGERGAGRVVRGPLTGWILTWMSLSLGRVDVDVEAYRRRRVVVLELGLGLIAGELVWKEFTQVKRGEKLFWILPLYWEVVRRKRRVVVFIAWNLVM